MVEDIVSASTELAGLQQQYTEMLNQIDTVAADSGYKGKNLLGGDTLVVKFEGDHKLDVVGFTASQTGLVSTRRQYDRRGDIDADVTKAGQCDEHTASAVVPDVHNLSIITVRPGFLDEHDQHADRRFGQADAGRCQ